MLPPLVCETLFFHVFGVGKTPKKVPPKRRPRWPHKASKRSQDAIWGPFWVQDGVQNGSQNGQKNDLAETLIFETPPTRNQGFCPPRPTENGTKKRLKNDLETKALKIRRFSALGGSKTGTRGPKASERVQMEPKWCPRGSSNMACIQMGALVAQMVSGGCFLSPFGVVSSWF